MKKTILIILITISFIGCKSFDEKKDKVIIADFPSLVQQWNDAHNNKDSETFIMLFSDSVEFYQMDITKNECVNRKIEFLSDNSDFYQQIDGDIQIDTISDNEIKCSFVKSVTLDLETSDYPSYLVFKLFEDEWKIIVEGDMVTDKNLNDNPNLRDEEDLEDIEVPYGEESIMGDFDGDGELEYAWVEEMAVTQDDMFDDEKCICYLRFSNPNIHHLKIDMCLMAHELVNEGDLDDNGTDEIGLSISHGLTSWGRYVVYKIVNNYVEPVTSLTTHASMFQGDIDLVRKSTEHKGYIIVISFVAPYEPTEEKFIKLY